MRMMHVKSKPLGFGELLYELRLKRHLTVAKATSAIGISAGYYCELENSKRRPPKPEVVQKIATGLRLTDAEKFSFFHSAACERASGEITAPCSPHVLEFVHSILAHSSDLDAGDVNELKALLAKLVGKPEVAI